MEIKLEIPAEIFDEGFPAAGFEARVREFAIMELLRAKRLHEHEAARMLVVERWELVEKMERAGIVPAEKEFDQIRVNWARRSPRSRRAALNPPPGPAAQGENDEPSAAYDDPREQPR